MKKLCYLVLGGVLLAGFTACGSKSKVNAKTASESAQEQAEMCFKGNYDDFISLVVFADTVEVEHAKKEAKKALTKRHKPVVEEKGGVQNITVTEETVAPSGQEAEVALENTYNNGEREIVVFHMVKDENVWKVKTGEDKEVWKTRTPEGHHISFKLKDGDEKDVFKERFDSERDFVKVKDGEDKDVLKIKEDGHKEVIKVKDKEDETVIKTKVDGEKEVERIKK